ncbi:hypothetical protein Tco_0690369 [Tanacetum coccineum]
MVTPTIRNDYDEVCDPVASDRNNLVILAYAYFWCLLMYRWTVKRAVFILVLCEDVGICVPTSWFLRSEVPAKFISDAAQGDSRTEFYGGAHFLLGFPSRRLKKEDGIFISRQTASTPIEINKALLKDEEAEDVDVYLYRFSRLLSESLHLPSSDEDLFRYLKGQRLIGLCYPEIHHLMGSIFLIVIMVGASLDWKS